MSDQRERISNFGRFLRETFGLLPHEGDRIGRHLVHLEISDTWRWAYERPETLSGPHPIEKETSA